MLSAPFLILALLSASLASPVQRRVERDVSTRGFVVKGKASQEATVPLTLGLPMADRDGLEAVLLDISDPASPNYGKWLSKEEVRLSMCIVCTALKTLLHFVAREVRCAEGRDCFRGQGMARESQHHCSCLQVGQLPDCQRPCPPGQCATQRRLYQVRTRELWHGGFAHACLLASCRA